MPTTYRQLRDGIAAYMHRQADVFLMNGQDMLLRAVNNAKNYAQREVDFEFAKKFAFMNDVSVVNGASFESGMLEFGTGNVILVKSIRRAFLQDSNSSGQIPVAFISRDSYVDRLKRRYEDSLGSLREVTASAGFYTTFPLSVVQVGFTVYVTPANDTTFGGATTKLYFDVFRWLPDFTYTEVAGTVTSTSSFNLVDTGKNFVSLGVRIGDVVTNTTDGTTATVVGVTSATTLALSADIMVSGETYNVAVVDPNQTNFLLDYCFDYMLFRSIWELNFYLKEDQRVQLSDKLMHDIWQNVREWNATIIGNNCDDANLG